MASRGETSGAGGSGGNGHKRPGLKLRMPERLSAGAYANSLVVHHGPGEFVTGLGAGWRVEPERLWHGSSPALVT